MQVRNGARILDENGSIVARSGRKLPLLLLHTYLRRSIRLLLLLLLLFPILVSTVACERKFTFSRIIFPVHERT